MNNSYSYGLGGDEYGAGPINLAALLGAATPELPSQLGKRASKNRTKRMGGGFRVYDTAQPWAPGMNVLTEAMGAGDQQEEPNPWGMPDLSPEELEFRKNARTMNDPAQLQAAEAYNSDPVNWEKQAEYAQRQSQKSKERGARVAQRASYGATQRKMRLGNEAPLAGLLDILGASGGQQQGGYGDMLLGSIFDPTARGRAVSQQGQEAEQRGKMFEERLGEERAAREEQQRQFNERMDQMAAAQAAAESQTNRTIGLQENQQKFSQGQATHQQTMTEQDDARQRDPMQTEFAQLQQLSASLTDPVQAKAAWDRMQSLQQALNAKYPGTASGGSALPPFNPFSVSGPPQDLKTVPKPESADFTGMLDQLMNMPGGITAQAATAKRQGFTPNALRSFLTQGAPGIDYNPQGWDVKNMPGITNWLLKYLPGTEDADEYGIRHNREQYAQQLLQALGL